MSQKLQPRPVWLRAETVRREFRAPLVPADVASLIEEGYRVTVETSSQRLFSEDEYAIVGAQIAPEGSWVDAPKDALIVGLRDLPSGNFPLVHDHVFFGHAFKRQAGAENLLRRFQQGGGTLFDYEALCDKNGRQLVSTSYWAGFVGAALAMWTWIRQQKELPTPTQLEPFGSVQHLMLAIQTEFVTLRWRPRVLITGARGASGAGAIDLVKELGVDVETWGRKDTETGAPFEKILGFDVLVHCIRTEVPVAPFLTRAMLDGTRRLTVVSDVTCDVGNPCNVFPWSDRTTSMAAPVRRYMDKPLLDILALDRLPALVPLECSEQFSSALTPLIVNMRKNKGMNVWKRAEVAFHEALESVLGKNHQADTQNG